MKIAFLGSGNVASHLAMVLKSKGEEIIQVFSPNLENAKILADRVDANFTDDLGKVVQNADLYIISVNDDAISAVAEGLKHVDGLVVHTSGTTPFDVLLPHVKYAGVFYPLQTFSKDKEISFDHIPICVEAQGENQLRTLTMLAEKLSDQVYQINGEKRKILHLAAVFAGNFSNHMYTLANQILNENDLDFNILRPLIAETADKIKNYLPESRQTGPAIRGDENTITKHLNMLTALPDLQRIYQTLSNSIKLTQK